MSQIDYLYLLLQDISDVSMFVASACCSHTFLFITLLEKARMKRD